MGFRAEMYTQGIFVHTNDAFTTEKQYNIINPALTITRGIDYEENIDFYNGRSSIGIDGMW